MLHSSPLLGHHGVPPRRPLQQSMRYSTTSTTARRSRSSATLVTLLPLRERPQFHGLWQLQMAFELRLMTFRSGLYLKCASATRTCYRRTAASSSCISGLRVGQSSATRNLGGVFACVELFMSVVWLHRDLLSVHLPEVHAVRRGRRRCRHLLMGSWPS